ncbi:hypothetical protein T636_A1729 [Enterobacter hormaechei subsp. xiangfangensis]|nr:hypothetical protein T636_A1729 [Enterobacter hormaechei subsp. xiangfangensis]RAL71880.1 hypothetical protein CSC35_0324 [Enterobacter hormaechei]
MPDARTPALSHREREKKLKNGNRGCRFAFTCPPGNFLLR